MRRSPSSSLMESSRSEIIPSPSMSSRPDRSNGKGKEVDNSQDMILSLRQALMALSCPNEELDTTAEAGVINFANTLASAKGSFINLPGSFDHSPAHSPPLLLEKNMLQLLVVTTSTPTVYLLRNPGGTLLTDPWMIATKDASTVLLVFRKKWSSVHVVARELTRRGARFNTVKATTTMPQPPQLSTVPLGIRLKGYSFTREDYDEYLRRRNHLLRGHKGRAALMHGGIIARIAREITEPAAVLDGPIYGDDVICEYNDLFFVDDQLTKSDKYIICGVYFTQTEQSPEGETLVNGAIRELSWWPQDSLWTSMGCYLLTEWTQLAEVFFEKRIHFLQTKLTIFGVSEWRPTLRKANAWTKKIEAGAEQYQREYLMHCYREMLLVRVQFLDKCSTCTNFYLRTPPALESRLEPRLV